MHIEEYAKKHPKNNHATILPETLKNIGTLKEGSMILDIGCAEGNTIQWLDEYFPNRYKYIGIDLSETRIEKAKEKIIAQAEFRVGTAENLPIDSGTVNFILASQVIEHVPSDTQMLMEVGRVLAPKGGFQIDTVYKKKWARYIYRSPSGWALDPTHVREYTDINAILSKFPPTLKVQSYSFTKSYRRFNIVSSLSWLPDWAKIRIPGYFVIFFIGSKNSSDQEKP